MKVNHNVFGQEEKLRGEAEAPSDGHTLCSLSVGLRSHEALTETSPVGFLLVIGDVLLFHYLVQRLHLRGLLLLEQTL